MHQCHIRVSFRELNCRMFFVFGVFHLQVIHIESISIVLQSREINKLFLNGDKQSTKINHDEFLLSSIGFIVEVGTRSAAGKFALAAQTK